MIESRLDTFRSENQHAFTPPDICYRKEHLTGLRVRHQKTIQLLGDFVPG